ncbi:sigma-70 family RNA polymerase sigma factor [Streptomyces decoyicus]|uniref:sigma-70 family RNA polymerase sigma factor n=1 Tax=Streptomyces decoyicus TaxID=249567 RepID=UPI00362D3B4A
MRGVLARAREELAAHGVHEPTFADLARHLDLPEDEVVDGLVACNGYDSDSMDRPIATGSCTDRQSGLVADLVGDDDPALALAEDIQALRPLLAHLEDRERTLIQLRFGDDMTQTQSADELGLSQMHASRLLTRSYATVRAGLLVEA